MKIELNEGTAARRRIPMRLFTSDGTSPDTSASSDSVVLGINSLGTIVPDSTVSEVNAAHGMYCVELSASDVSVLGVHPLYHTQGSFPQHVANIEVVNSNPYSTQSNDPRITLSGTASSGSITGLVLAGGSGTTAFYDGQLVALTGGTGVGQARTILDYRGDNNLATVTREFATAPDGTSNFIVMAADIPAILEAGTAQGGAAGTITLDAQASAIDSTYVDAWIMITAGTGLGQTRVIGVYNGTTKVATVTPNWTTTPDATSVYQVVPAARVDVAAWAGNAVTASGGNPDVNVESIDAIDSTLTVFVKDSIATIAGVTNVQASAVASSVWAEPRSSHITSGTMGQVMQVSSDSVLQGGTTSTISLGSGETSVDDVFNGAPIDIQYPDGTWVGNFISDYTGAEVSAQLQNALAVTPTSACTYVIFTGSEGVDLSAATVGSVLTVVGFDSATSFAIKPGSYSDVTIQGLSNRTDFTVLVNQDKDNYTLSTVAEQSMSSSLLSTNLGNDRYVQDALMRMRNRVDATSGSVMTVYDTDDTTSAWTASVSTGAFPLSEINPA
jgi:hypothetical protein